MTCFKTQEQVMLSRSFCGSEFTAVAHFLYSSLELCSCLGYSALNDRLFWFVCFFNERVNL